MLNGAGTMKGGCGYDEGEMGEPGYRAILLAQPANELAGEERRRRLVGAVDGWRAGDFQRLPVGRPVDAWRTGAGIDAAQRQPGQPLLLVLRQELSNGEAGQNALVASQDRVVRRVALGVGADIL